MTVSADKVAERIAKLDKIAGEYQEFLGGAVSLIRHQAGVHEPDEIKKTVEKHQHDGRMLRIGIIGRMKAGKSSLLNALVFDGHDVLPKAATPMTAALTILSYAEKLTIKPEFFSQEDMDQFRKLHDDFLSKIEEIATKIQEEDEARQARQKHGPTTGSNSPQKVTAQNTVQASEQQKLRAKKLAVEKFPTQAAAYDHWLGVTRAGGVSKCPKQGEARTLEYSPEKLAKSLMDYVSAEGKYVYFTKHLHLGLPVKELEGLEIVDTPGFNDPIISREARTQNELKSCDTVFIVSPAGQFLSQQDMELLGRLSAREGVCELYLIASQIDNQLYGRELDDLSKSLPGVIAFQKTRLMEHAQSTFAALLDEQPALKQLVVEGATRVITTSAVCHSLYQLKANQWNEETEFAYNNLKNHYPDYFNSPETSKKWMLEISGITLVKQAVESVRSRKSEIFSQKSKSYLDGQERASVDFRNKLNEETQRQLDEIKNKSHQSAKKELEEIEQKTTAGTIAADAEFKIWIEEHAFSIEKDLKHGIKAAYEDSRQASDNAQGSESDSREEDKPGLGARVARLFSLGGTRTVHYQVTTLDVAKVRRAVSAFRDALEVDLISITQEASMAARKTFKNQLLGTLREKVAHPGIA